MLDQWQDRCIGGSLRACSMLLCRLGTVQGYRLLLLFPNINLFAFLYCRSGYIRSMEKLFIMSKMNSSLLHLCSISFSHNLINSSTLPNSIKSGTVSSSSSQALPLTPSSQISSHFSVVPKTKQHDNIPLPENQNQNTSRPEKAICVKNIKSNQDS